MRLMRRHRPKSSRGVLQTYNSIGSEFRTVMRLGNCCRLVQKCHAKSARITPNYLAYRIDVRAWNAQPKSCGHETRVRRLNDCGGCREVADLAAHWTAINQDLSCADNAFPLIRHIPPFPI